MSETTSTNNVARQRARDGAPHGTVVVAEHQTSGRGRLGRAWVSGAGLGLHASWIARPQLPVEQWTVLPLLAGVALVEAVRARTRVAASLKWPNDLRANDGKLGGILTEAEPPSFVVVGVGVNVSHTEFPPDLKDIATSIAMCEGIRLDRADLLAHALRGFMSGLENVGASLERYRTMCDTLGRNVRVERPGAEPITGVARDIDATGGLLVDVDGDLVLIASGDVEHLRDA